MKRSDIAKLAPAVILSLVLGALITAWAWGAPAPQAAGPQVTAEQQQQLGRLKELEEQLPKDRQAFHQAAAQSGSDSDQADVAQEQLFRDREEYRKLRRTLRAARVAVPPPYDAGTGTKGGRLSAGPRPAGSHGMCADCPSMADCSCCPR